uniref:Chitobiosyldiphosphodolichol beta-mannosyltransferase n=1 Tax=Callorhinchus milii TaxID=7868 RepID=A0A4W3I6V4_CALMI
MGLRLELSLLFAAGAVCGYSLTCLGLPLLTGLVLLGLGTCLASLVCHRAWGRAERAGKACVLVLGDLGRSPRMQYHSLSLARHGLAVTLLGYPGAKPHQDVLYNEKIKIFHIPEITVLPFYFIVGPRIFQYGIKVFAQTIQICYSLLKIDAPAYILLQNPPGLPAIAAAWAVCLLRGSKLIVDWHNYGYTIMQLTHGERHPIVLIAKWYEKLFGKFSNFNLCVTKAMQEDLKQNWNIKAITLYDCPPPIFRETPLELQHKLFKKLAYEYSQFTARIECVSPNMEQTAFTEMNLDTGIVTHVRGRPALLLSSTSWTGRSQTFFIPHKYEGFIIDGFPLPSLICVITGKGPLKEFYNKLIEKINFKYVHICTPWLEAEDYPVLLGSGDLGVCLHKSSSGLDLPMKVVDMFGCCLPVCAIHFQCLHELVKHEENGLIFKSSHELAEQLKLLFTDFRSENSKLSLFKRTLRESKQVRWDENWDQIVLPLLIENE